jgi:hypothetical protein
MSACVACMYAKIVSWCGIKAGEGRLYNYGEDSIQVARPDGRYLTASCSSAIRLLSPRTQDMSSAACSFDFSLLIRLPRADANER